MVNANLAVSQSCRWKRDHPKETKASAARYRARNRASILRRQRECYARNKDRYKPKYRARYWLNRKHILLQNKENREARTKSNRAWKRANPDRVRANRRKDESNPIYRLRSRLRCRISSAILRYGVKKNTGTEELMGCSVAAAKLHLGSLFLPGMSWQNYGEWHIDHKRPCSSFNLLNKSEQLECFNWRNLQPMWAKENMRKGAKLNWPNPTKEGE